MLGVPLRLVLASLVLAAVVSVGWSQAGFQDVVNDLGNKTGHVKVKWNQMWTRLNTLTRQVAFSVNFLFDRKEVQLNHPLLYDNVLTNIGEAYNEDSGTFTAPVTGVYVFFVNCMASMGARQESWLKMPGKVLAVCFSEVPSNNSLGSVMATSHLTAGQIVWVEVTLAQYVRGHLWNTFSGYLLQADA